MNDSSIFETIRALDQKRSQALLDGDIDEVGNYLGSSLRYIHSSSTDEDLALYLKKLRDGFYQYKILDTSDQDFRRFGDTVIVNGVIHVHVVAGGVDKDFHARYTQIWVIESDDWKMVSWQTTLLPT